jgi:hypothetical protein
MNNLECVVSVLAAHREARMWNDVAVAADVVAQLELDPAGEAKNAKPVTMPGITEDEVLAHETAAKDAVAKAEAARAALEAEKADNAAKAEVVFHDAEATRSQAEAARQAQQAAMNAQAARDDAARVERERDAEAARAPAPAPPSAPMPLEPSPLVHSEPVPPIA